MSMKVVSKSKDVLQEVKPMNTMESEEVCYCEEKDHYVVCVIGFGKTLFLILNDTSSRVGTNSYDSDCQLLVRSLARGESVTVEFS